MQNAKLVAALLAANLVAIGLVGCSVSRTVEKEAVKAKIEKLTAEEKTK